MITRQSQPRQKERILSQRSKENLILLGLDDGKYYALNRVGGRVWELCDGTRTVSEIVSILCQEYAAPAATIEKDALELLGDLANGNLVVEAS
jgi:hypothetical protein